MFSGAGNATYLFTHYVRDPGALRIEEAVHAVTGKHARFFGSPTAASCAGRVGRPRRVRARRDRAAARGARRRRPRRQLALHPAARRLPGDVVGGVPTWLDGAATGARPARSWGRPAGLSVLERHATALAVEPAEQRRHRAGVLAEVVAGAADDAEVRGAVGFAERAGVLHRTTVSSLPCMTSNACGARSPTASSAGNMRRPWAHSSNDGG